MPEGDPVDELEGHYWIDSDNDCQNTRHELLLRESLEPVTFSTTSQCRVLTGKWYGQYLGVFFTESSDLDLDHIIPLKWAHEHGGWRWSAEVASGGVAEWPDQGSGGGREVTSDHQIARLSGRFQCRHAGTHAPRNRAAEGAVEVLSQDGV